MRPTLTVVAVMTPRLHRVRWEGNTPRAVCGAPLTEASRWTAVAAYFHHPRYQPDTERCRNCKRSTK